MSLLFYCCVAFLPFFLVAYRVPARWSWDAQKPCDSYRRALLVSLFYVLPLVLVWACAAGVFPTVDRILFSREPQHWCNGLESGMHLPADSFLECKYLSFFLCDDLTTIFLALAAASWWMRDAVGFPRWLPKMMAVVMFFFLMEENKFLPFSFLVNRDWGNPSFALHDAVPGMNRAISHAISIAACAWFLLAVAQSLIPKRLPSWIQAIRLPHIVHLFIAFMLAKWILKREMFRPAEPDKYSDVGQAIYYAASFLVSLEYPCREADREPESSSAQKGRVRACWVLFSLTVICILSRMLLAR